MTDPLLTIEDATREFRVSPKTIRRRLSSGEIDGAYKRPGSRGPEWVMPRQSLAEAGFVPRPLAAPATLPADADERAAYWEHRAVDAEAALRAAEGSPVRARRQDWRGLGWAFVGVSLLIALVVALVVLSGDGDEEAGSAPDATGAMPLVIELLLERRTDPGEAIGLVGDRRTDALPRGRVAAASPRDGWASSTGPRFVVATFDDEAPPAPVRALRATSEVLLRAPHGVMVVEVYDRHSPGDGDASEVASPPQGAPGATGDDAPTAGPEADAPQDAAPAPAPGPADTLGGVQVHAGESFWSIAEDRVVADLGPDASDASVTSYWSALVRANADRLVEPGNPDLLHVGQTILLPPLA